MKLSASLFACLFAVAAVVSPVLGDVYGHNPRFSNGRLNGGATGRLFNSQNNGNGGYRWGPTMTFYAGSILSIEWTSQHSCGQDNNECNMIIQYICSPAGDDGNTLIRDGTTDGDIRGGDPMDKDDTTGEYKFGMHENKAYYEACGKRSRNKGLFLADQNRGDNAYNSRQANNQQNGYECNEERDYYPYWQPTPWRDIAVLTTNKGNCKMYQAESQNVKAKNYCEGANGGNGNQPIMQQECLSAGGQWKSTPAFGLPKPDCQQAPWGRDNHLGNGFSGSTHSYNWTIFTSKQESCVNSPGGCNCALRIRYNISTSETNNWGSGAIDSRMNGASSPIKNTPNVMVAGNNFTMNVNTAQFGRVFQDRTHMFVVAQRPKNIPANAKIYNLNVRGKRGNIVTNYPAVELDFVPQHLIVKVGDYIHFQWTGAETGNNDGQGRGSTDRSNIVQMAGPGYNYPIVDGKEGKTKMLFDSVATRAWMSNLGQVDCPSQDQIQAQATAQGINRDQVADNCFVLNKTPNGYFNGGVMKMNKTGDFYYMSSRNNQFSNRTQKGLIQVNPLLTGWQIALVVIGAAVVATAGAAAGCVIYAKKNPHSGVANFVGKVPLLNRI